MAGNTILVVDDEQRMRKLVRDFLTKQNFRVLEAADGEEAVDVFMENKDIVLVILDVMMPKIDGFGVCELIRRESNVPIIMLTALDEEAYQIKGFDMNADDSRYQSLSSGSMGAYEFMSYVISNKIITVGQLALKPCSGSAVVTNPNNGDILALVSYPSYDNNKLSGTVDAKYYSSLVTDNASPLLNRATQSFIAPGST